MSQEPAQVVVVGSGFAGFFAARKLAWILPRELAEVTMVSTTDHADWLVNLVSRPTATQLGLVQESAAHAGHLLTQKA